MTLNRYLLLFALIIGSTLAFLSFAPPQTGKWVYMWQAYALQKNLLSSGKITNYIKEPDKALFIKNDIVWSIWRRDGTLALTKYLDANDRSYISIQFDENGQKKMTNNLYSGGSQSEYVNQTLEWISIPNPDWKPPAGRRHGNRRGARRRDGEPPQGDYYLTVFWRTKGIDRRAEFGIEVE